MTGNKTLDQLRVLVVDDEADIRLGLSRLMKSIGAESAQAASGHEALDWLKSNTADIILTDLMMPGMSGAELLTEVKSLTPEVPVVILTAFGTIQTAVSCLQSGAAHFLTKPFDNHEVQELVRRLGRHILASRAATKERNRQANTAEIIVEDPRTARLYALVQRIAKSPIPVLIEGESGTGKEVIARAIHAESHLAERPFLAVNAAALTDTLLESELFGHRRGSFTGAERDHKGLFEAARGGTVFLDEVASMPLSFQGKLLRVLQERVVRPVGSSADVPVDFRLVTATNRDLSEMVKNSEFRDDLYYRLRVLNVLIPPLRDRPGDIIPLAHLFLSRATVQCLPPEGPTPELSESAQKTLLDHPWPGNVRELENAIQRAVIVCGGDKIHPHHLGLIEERWSPGETSDEMSYGEAKRKTVERFQREFVQKALHSSGGNVSRAAVSCGLTRAALQKILRQQGIDRSDFQ